MAAYITISMAAVKFAMPEITLKIHASNALLAARLAIHFKCAHRA